MEQSSALFVWTSSESVSPFPAAGKAAALSLTLGWDHAESITSLAQLARSLLWLENCCVKVALSLFWIVARTRRIPPATQPFPGRGHRPAPSQPFASRIWQLNPASANSPVAHNPGSESLPPPGT